MSDQSRTNTRAQKGRSYPPGYGLVEPVANYRPWDVDREFADVYELVREHTMVDVYRLWTLWYLARQIAGARPDPGEVVVEEPGAELPGDAAPARASGPRVPAGPALDGHVLEIGSWRGGSGTVIARALVRSGAARRIILADTFAGVVKAGERDTYYKGGEHANTSVDAVQQLLARAGVPHVELLSGVFPEDRGEEIADLRFALCHIDVDVYQSAKDCFEWVWPRMVPGGVVVFDDFGFYGCEGVTAYVHELARTGGPRERGGEDHVRADDRLVVVPSLSGQAIVTR
ncbi:MAG: TylF/MycF/NovP-related O-methyltransferase [Spirochaetota bacterium]